MEFEERQMKQCQIKYFGNPKKSPYSHQSCHRIKLNTKAVKKNSTSGTGPSHFSITEEHIFLNTDNFL
jgi:hypothetical protein